jgi:Ca2+-binding EF-hand superfamily protein
MDSLFASADTNGDGQVDFGEFFTMLATNVAQAAAAMQKGRGGGK